MPGCWMLPCVAMRDARLPGAADSGAAQLSAAAVSAAAATCGEPAAAAAIPRSGGSRVTTCRRVTGAGVADAAWGRAAFTPLACGAAFTPPAVGTSRPAIACAGPHSLARSHRGTTWF